MVGMGYVKLYIKTGKKRAQRLRERALDLGQRLDLKEAIKSLTKKGRALFEERDRHYGSRRRA